MKLFAIYEASVGVTELGLLAIMPMDTMRRVLRLHDGAVARIEVETENKGACQICFNDKVPFGFTNNVVVTIHN